MRQCQPGTPTAGRGSGSPPPRKRRDGEHSECRGRNVDGVAGSASDKGNEAIDVHGDGAVAASRDGGTLRRRVWHE